jgi:hypothetical protein
MFDVSRTYKHSALRWVGILAATDTENERIRATNTTNQAENDRRTAFNNSLAAMTPEQRGTQQPLDMLPITPELSPEEYVQRVLDVATFSYADQHASRIAQSAIGRLAAMPPAKQMGVLTAMGLQDLAALPPASRAKILAGVVEKAFRELPIEQREELASLAYAEYGPQV